MRGMSGRMTFSSNGEFIEQTRMLEDNAHLSAPAVPVGRVPAGHGTIVCQDLTLGRAQKTGQNMQQRAFAGAGRS